MRFFAFIFLLLLTISEGQSADNPIQVIMETELGTIKLEINTQKAPITSANFLKYVDEKRWKGAHFYRVVRLNNQPKNDIKIEVIQGGLGWREDPQRLASIKHETTKQTKIKHRDGVISMARAEPGTADSEFFICIGDQPELDFGGKRNPDGQGFATFGRVIQGMEVVRNIHKGKDEGQMLKKTIAIKNIKRK